MDFSKCNILVVDDDPIFGKFYTRLIEKEFNAEYFLAKNPYEAFDYLKQHVPSLIILDMQMPEMDGYTFLTKLRSFDATRNIPVIACTSLRNKDLVVGLSELKIIDYIVKTGDPQVYIDRISKALEKIQDAKKKL